MSAQFNLNTIKCSIPSICIPRTFSNITEKRIRDVFDQLDFGTIDRVDMVPIENEKGQGFNRVFIHFVEWNNIPNIDEARQRLLSGNEIKIMYDDPWFWRVSALRTKKIHTAHHNAVVETTSASHKPAFRHCPPTRTISAEMCGAYDYDRNCNLVPYKSFDKKEFIKRFNRQLAEDNARTSNSTLKVTKTQFIEKINRELHENTLKTQKEALDNGLHFKDDCECFRCRQTR